MLANSSGEIQSCPWSRGKQDKNCDPLMLFLKPQRTIHARLSDPGVHFFAMWFAPVGESTLMNYNNKIRTTLVHDYESIIENMNHEKIDNHSRPGCINRKTD
jgi:hypothetical protein